MSLKIIAGKAGSGKSTKVYNDIIEKSIKYPEKNSIVIVPEQFTMETQKELVIRHPNKGIINIDVLSFERLAHKIFEELGVKSLSTLDETGKSILIRRVLDTYKNDLIVFKNKASMKGFVSEMKSVISEFEQYRIEDNQLENVTKDLNKPLINSKLLDIMLINNKFKEYIKDRFITNEGVLNLLLKVIENSQTIKNTTIVFDGFTGFTPTQYKIIEKLLFLCEEVIITATLPKNESYFKQVKEQELFRMSKTMINNLAEMSKNLSVKIEPIFFMEDVNNKSRFENNGEIDYLEQNLFRYKKFENNTYLKDEVSIIECQSPKEEINFVLNKIKNMVSSGKYRYRDFAIITGDMESYYRHITDGCNIGKIPAFIDHKRSVIDNPGVELIRAILDIAKKDYSYESVFRLLKNILIDIDNNLLCRLENYIIALGIRGKSMWSKNFSISGMAANEDELIVLNDIRKNVFELVNKPYIVLADKNENVKNKIIALYNFIKDCNVKKKLEDLSLQYEKDNNHSKAKEYNQVYEIIIEMFERIVLLMGEEKLSLNELIDVLDSGFLDIKQGIIPPGIDQIIAGDIERTRLSHIKVLFLVGVNDNIIPKKAGTKGILSESDRQLLENMNIKLAPNVKESSFMERFYIYLNLTKASDKVYISYSKISNSKDSLRPSYLISMLKNMLNNKKIKEYTDFNSSNEIRTFKAGLNYIAMNMENYKNNNINNLFREVFSYLLNNKEYNNDLLMIIKGSFNEKNEIRLSEAVAKELYGENLNSSVSRIEKYAACAYSHFLAYGLALAERKEHKIELSDLGTMYHCAIENVSKFIDESNIGWKNITDETRKEFVKTSVEIAINQCGNKALTSSARNAYTINKLTRITDKTIWALCNQIKAGNFMPAFFEYGIEKGRIDRIDTYEEDGEIYIKIIDYKTGNRKFELSSAYYGIHIQLAAYMKSVIEQISKRKENKNKTIIPGAMFYYNINDPFVNMETANNPSVYLQKFMPSGLINGKPRVISALDEDFTTSSSVMNVKKKKDGNYTASSSVATTDQFNLLLDFVGKEIEEFNKEINSGDIKINPYKSGTKTACDYCQYKSICGFDPSVPDNEFRRLSLGMKNEQVWEKINEWSKKCQK